MEHVFNVTSGVVKLYKLMLDGRRQITGFLLPGDFLGLASRTGYSYSAEAVTPVSLCRFPRHRLEEAFDRFPHLQRRLFDIANDELVAAQDQMLLLGRKTALEKNILIFIVPLRARAAPGRGCRAGNSKTTRKDQTENDGEPALAIPQIRRLIS